MLLVSDERWSREERKSIFDGVNSNLISTLRYFYFSLPHKIRKYFCRFYPVTAKNPQLSPMHSIGKRITRCQSKSIEGLKSRTFEKGLQMKSLQAFITLDDFNECVLSFAKKIHTSSLVSFCGFIEKC